MMEAISPGNEKRPTGRRSLIGGMAAAAGVGLTRPAFAASVPTLSVGYVHWRHRVETISYISTPALDNGLSGAELGIDDNNTTGRFMNQRFALVAVDVPSGGDPVAALNTMLDKGVRLVVTDRPAPDVLKLSEAARARGATIFNAGAPDDRLRQEDCRANVVHTAPSHSMLSDALAQYLLWKRWSRWLLAYGEHPDDLLFANAIRGSAKKFGARIVAARQYKEAAGSRESGRGLEQIQTRLPVFTQNAPHYDVLVTADENHVFAGYMPFRTWDPRPVAGSSGLMPTSWDPNMLEFAGRQMQDRFIAYAHRFMTALDMNAWVAIRAIGTAASYTQSLDPAKIMTYMRSSAFALGAYRPLSLSVRTWNGQMRQAILLSDSGRCVVSVSPQPGFLHKFNVLDTLGIDEPAAACRLQRTTKG